MSNRLKLAAVAAIVAISAAQAVRPQGANPTTDASRTIAAQFGTDHRLGAVLDRSCRDCHSNQTVQRWYARVAPVSWLMARGVAEGRKAVNFSEWASYSPEQQRRLLAVSCDDAKSGKMPGPYTWIRPETKLSPKDVDTICAAGRRP